MQSMLARSDGRRRCNNRQASLGKQLEAKRNTSNRCLTNCVFVLHFIVLLSSIRILDVHGQGVLQARRAHRQQARVWVLCRRLP